MKKLIAILLSSVMIFSLAACGKSGDGNENAGTESIGTENMETAGNETEMTETAGSETENSEIENGGTDGAGTENAGAEGNVIAPEVGEETMGGVLWNAFLETMAANPEITPEEMANTLNTNPVIQFSPVTMPVEAGYLAGFDVEIDGFEEGVLFAPMIGSIPFVGYVFRLADGADVNAFITTLTDNANPRWNICVEADQTVIGAYDNIVFFLMCPESSEG